MNFYNKSIAQVLTAIKSNESTGLSEQEVLNRKKIHHNVLNTASKGTSIWNVFFHQWKSPLILILVVAGIVSAALHEYMDAVIIGITVVLNVFIGFFQEYKANTSLKSLESFATPTVLVRRDGNQQRINSNDVVPGDILLLQSGDYVPADARIIATQGLVVNEAALTGESKGITKDVNPVAEKVPLADRTSMVYRGTTIEEGGATVVVTAVGKDSEIGAIASLIADTKEDLTPLQAQISRLARVLSISIVIIALSIFVIGLLFGQDRYTTFELFETAVAVSVAAIPEGLVISLTVILAIGMQFILKRNAVVRRLVAAETLGSVDIICTDKTGTLTEGNMSVVQVVTAQGTVSIDKLSDSSATKNLLQIAGACNDATRQKKDGVIQYVGNITDQALLRFYDTYGNNYNLPIRLDTLAFSSIRKYMATLHEEKGKYSLFVKGAPEVILKKVTHYQKGNRRYVWSTAIEKKYASQIATLAEQGYRALALASAEVKNIKKINEKDIKELTLVGIVAIADPVRKDVPESIAIAQKAGIRVIMITGDHAYTAVAIAKQVGIYTGGKLPVCVGKDIDAMSDDDLRDILAQTSIFARVTPAHKIRLVSLLQANGHVAAMTGDGVNDAPALKGASIGVAVGSGTAVAKGAADMVLLNNSFTTIVDAIESGRGIYVNIKKVIAYLLSGTFAEVLLILSSIVAGMPIAAIPAQILWINLIADTFPTMSLAFEPTEKNVMDESPRKKFAPIIDGKMKAMIITKSIFANIILFIIFWWYLKTTNNIDLARTMVFVGFGIDALFDVFSLKSFHTMIWNIPILSNKYLLWAVAFGWVMLILAVHAPFFQFFLRTVSIGLNDWIIMVAFGLYNMVLIELVKAVYIYKARAKVQA